jgi:glycosyltransferase involved in cell wall biosynthesis
LQYDADYQRWIEQYEQDAFLPPIKGRKSDPNKPLFSIVIPFFNTPNKYLEPLLNSLLSQSFGDWELIMGDASTDVERRKVIKDCSKRDPRFVYRGIEKNGGISYNTNKALEIAKGNYIVFADHDDTLSPHALNEIAAQLNDNPDLDVFYSDEDKLTDDGRLRHSPFFKPDWSPHMFLNGNYTNHLSVVKKELVDEVGGLDPERDGAQDFDFLLRIHSLPRALQVCHIDKVLYHWREAKGSTAANFGNKLYAYEAGRTALENYMKRKGLKGTSELIDDRPGFYRLRLYPQKKQKVLMIVSAASNQQDNHLVLEQIKARTLAKHIKLEFKEAQNKTDINNIVQATNADIVFIVQHPILPIEATWVDELCGVLGMEDVGVVAPRIIGKGGVIEDLGLVKLPNGECYPLLHKYPAKFMTRHSHPEWIHDVDTLKGRVFGLSVEDAKKLDFNKLLASQLERSDGTRVVVWSHSTVYESGAHTTRGGYFNVNLELAENELLIWRSK